MELSERQSEFDELGIRILVMTYEPAEKNLKFTSQYEVGYSILSDPDSLHIKAFGLLDESYGEDSMAHGVPRPGIFLVDNKGIIHAKFAEADYRDRPAIDLIIEAATAMAKGE